MVENNPSSEDMEKEILKALRIANASGLPWESKGTVYICLAYEYYNIGKDQEGSELLAQIPQSYFKMDMQRDLAQVEGFLEVTLLLIKLMSASNAVVAEEVVRSLTLIKGDHGSA